MILVDTSVWIDHFRSTDATLVDLLNESRVLAHPFVVGELALGSIRQRSWVLSALKALPRAPLCTDEEVLLFIEHNALHGCGIGYVDAHLLASTRLKSGTAIWTRDKRLREAGERLGLGISF